MMDKNRLTKALKELIEKSKQRKFKQTVDLIISLTGIDLKKPENKIELFLTLPNNTGKTNKICGLVGPELLKDSQQAFDKTISIEEFSSYTNKKDIKKLIEEYDIFVGQANIMTNIASTFGRFLGPKGKMPNPKLGSIVAPGTNLKQIYNKLKNIKRIVSTKGTIQTSVGKQDQKIEDLAENILSVYSGIVEKLPNEEHNIKTTYIKLTMSAPIKIK